MFSKKIFANCFGISSKVVFSLRNFSNQPFSSGWMDLQHDDKHKTDVHYRSLDGVGMFNWRWILPFKYIPEERMMIVEKKVGCIFIALRIM